MDEVRKAKANLEMRWVKDVNGKGKVRENVGLLLDVSEDMVTKDMEKTKVFNAFFISIFTSKTGLQPWNQRWSLEQGRFTVSWGRER